MIYAPPVAATAESTESSDDDVERALSNDLKVLVDDVQDRSDDVARALQELASLLVAEENVATTLQRVAELAKATIPGCHAAGVTLRNGRRYESVAWTDGRTIAIDEEQYARDHGPCLEALRSRQVVRTNVDGAQARWPDFAAAARKGGIESFLAAPLMLHGEGIGALNLYSRELAGFDALDDALVAMFAAQATVALANARMYTQAVTLSQQLEQALVSRAPIEQAKGVLMARYGYTDDEAFDHLRQLSQRRNVKLRDVAVEITNSVRRTAPATGVPAAQRNSPD